MGNPWPSGQSVADSGLHVTTLGIGLRWKALEADSETRTLVQVAYVGGDSRKHQWGGGEEGAGAERWGGRRLRQRVAN